MRSVHVALVALSCMVLVAAGLGWAGAAASQQSQALVPRAVLKLIIDHPALAPYLHPEVTGRVPLIVSDHLLEPGGYILMRPSNFMAAVLLAVVALAHLLRLIFGLQVTV